MTWLAGLVAGASVLAFSAGIYAVISVILPVWRDRDDLADLNELGDGCAACTIGYSHTHPPTI